MGDAQRMAGRVVDQTSGLVYMQDAFDTLTADSFLKVKLTKEGDPCRHCNRPVVWVIRKHPPKGKRSYYFSRWLNCPMCKELVSIPYRFGTR